MREIKKKSIVPVYGVAASWALYCVFLPLYKTWHFIALACISALAYVGLSALFPGKSEFVEVPEAPAEPERTGDDAIDALLAEGEKAVAEMRKLQASITDETVRGKLDGIIDVTDKIFKDLLDDPADYKLVKRFAEYYLPTTIKLLHAYDRFGKTEEQGENISGTIERIDAALDSILASYRKYFDSLFENQAIDIETDIRVLESLLNDKGFG